MSTHRPPGTEAWLTRDYGGDGKGLSLSKATLGIFVYHLLRLGGGIMSTYVMNPKYDRSYCQMAVYLPSGLRSELEAVTGITLEKPSEMKPA